MKTKALFASVIFAALLCISCGKSEVKRIKPLVFNDVVHKKSSGDTTQTYEVYIPVSNSKQKHYPVIYLFDPHADGKLAISKFKKAAELYGFILVASNNSKNGIENLEYIIKILLNDALNTLPIDTERQYAAGFSGGGRVAGFLALKNPNIKGIITCSAGFSPQNASRTFEVYSIAGMEDFNYVEVLSRAEQLLNLNWISARAFFNGGHSWPPAEYIEKAVLWLQLNAIKKQLIPVDEDLIRRELDSFLKRAEEYSARNQMILAANECSQGIAYLNSLVKTTKLEEKLQKIQKSQAYKREKEKENQIFSLEEKLKKAYLQAFSQEDIIWWKNEVNELNREIEKENDLQMLQMLKRLKGFLGIVCYSFTSKTAKGNDIEMLSKLVDIYELVEPQNSDCFFYKAVLNYKLHNIPEAKKHYKKAKELGFNDDLRVKELLSRLIE